MDTYESKLKKDSFFQKIQRLEIEGVVLVDEVGRGDDKPTGFIIGGIWVSVFIGSNDSVWLGLKNTKENPSGKEKLLRDLQLEYAETYPYVLESPSKEVMEIWQKRKKS